MLSPFLVVFFNCVHFSSCSCEVSLCWFFLLNFRQNKHWIINKFCLYERQLFKTLPLKKLSFPGNLHWKGSVPGWPKYKQILLQEKREGIWIRCTQNSFWQSVQPKLEIWFEHPQLDHNNPISNSAVRIFAKRFSRWILFINCILHNCRSLRYRSRFFSENILPYGPYLKPLLSVNMRDVTRDGCSLNWPVDP